jgi:ABC-type nitrate/sulfonate/bicarbonate transport system permease component
MWVYVILLGLIGLALDAAFRALNRRLFHWAEVSR